MIIILLYSLLLLLLLLLLTIVNIVNIVCCGWRARARLVVWSWATFSFFLRHL